MLTLFRPWKTGLNLKNDDDTWNDAFMSHKFSKHQREIMANMNIRYECLDAQDDFHAQMKKGLVSMPNWAEEDNTLQTNLDQTIADDNLDITKDADIVADIHIVPTFGKAQLHMQNMMASIRRTLIDAGWTNCNAKLLSSDLQLTPEPVSVSKPPGQWNASVMSACAHVLEERA